MLASRDPVVHFIERQGPRGLTLSFCSNRARPLCHSASRETLVSPRLSGSFERSVREGTPPILRFHVAVEFDLVPKPLQLELHTAELLLLRHFLPFQKKLHFQKGEMRSKSILLGGLAHGRWRFPRSRQTPGLFCREKPREKEKIGC